MTTDTCFLRFYSSSRSPESGICTSSMSLPSSSSGSNEKSGGRDVGEVDEDIDEDEEEFFEAETLPIIGRCHALYPFEGTYFENDYFHLFYFF